MRDGKGKTLPQYGRCWSTAHIVGRYDPKKIPPAHPPVWGTDFRRDRGEPGGIRRFSTGVFEWAFLGAESGHWGNFC